MNTIKFTLVAALLTFGINSYANISNASTSGFTKLQDYDDGEVSYQTFYDELSPYGDWIYDPQYGYVWRPDMGPGFMPYRTGGHWVASEIGWTWASDYRWGWAPFHYGRWRFDNYLGWYWIPGYEWAPAWVVWSSNADYYGWAPMAPGWNINVSINLGSIPSNYWVFAPPRYITNVHMYDYCAPVRQNVTIVRNVTVVNNCNYYNRVRYVCGPRIVEYNRHPGCNARPVPVKECNDRRGSRYDNQGIYVYRPRVVERVSSRPQVINTKEYYANRTEAPRDKRKDYNSGYDNNGNRQRNERPSKEYGYSQPNETYNRGNGQNNDKGQRYERPDKEQGNSQPNEKWDNGRRPQQGNKAWEQPQDYNNGRSESPRQQNPSQPDYRQRNRGGSQESPRQQRTSQPEYRQVSERGQSDRGNRAGNSGNQNGNGHEQGGESRGRGRH